MIEEIKTAYKFLVVLGIGALLLLFSMMVPVMSSNSNFSIYNTGWSGCSDLGRETYSTGSFLPTIDISSSSEERIIHSSLSELGSDIDPSDSAIMIIGPETDFTNDELEFLDLFLRDGGIMLIADDVGTGDQVLSHLDTSTRITGDIMSDLSYMKQPEFAVTTNISSNSITNDVERLLLNYPSTISPSRKAVPVFNSSTTSWLDRDRNNRRDPDEPMGPFNLMTIEDYGRGKLIVLSDPSLLINQMRDRFDNSIFVSNLIGYMTEDRGTIVIDESHRDMTNPVHFTNSYIADMRIEEKIGILTGLMVIFVLVSTPHPGRIWRRLERLLNKLLSEEERTQMPSREDILSDVMRRHPDWDRTALEKFMKDMEG